MKWLYWFPWFIWLQVMRIKWRGYVRGGKDDPTYQRFARVDDCLYKLAARFR